MIKMIKFKKQKGFRAHQEENQRRKKEKIRKNLRL